MNNPSLAILFAVSHAQMDYALSPKHANAFSDTRKVQMDSVSKMNVAPQQL